MIYLCVSVSFTRGYIMPKSKHLTLDERYIIQHMLDNSFSFKAIARKLERDCTTISKEVRTRKVSYKMGSYGHVFNDCSNLSNCQRTYLCDDLTCKKSYCRYCKKCSSFCSDYVKNVCSKIMKPPYVCNPCDSHRLCFLERSFYKALSANTAYKDLLSDSRSGFNFTEEEICRLDTFFSPLIKKGQSIHHICFNNRDVIMHSEKTIYNLIDAGLFSIRNIDLPRKVRYRPRKSNTGSFKVDKKCRVNRTYEDYQAYCSANPELSIVQMDSVIGSKGGKTLLTLHFINSNFMLAFLRDNNTARSVTDIFFDLYFLLTPSMFSALFQIVLTDNGSEFSNPRAIEYDEQDNQRSRVFYCDPGAPYQKGAAEVNHELIRRILPKGKSFDCLTQNDVNCMMSHINSYGREKLNNRSPFQLFSLLYGEDITQKLGIELIPPNEIDLTPKLIK